MQKDLKLKAYDLLAKHLGLFERHNKQIAEGVADLISSLDGKSKGLPNG